MASKIQSVRNPALRKAVQQGKTRTPAQNLQRFANSGLAPKGFDKGLSTAIGSKPRARKAPAAKKAAPRAKKARGYNYASGDVRPARLYGKNAPR